MTAGTGSVRTDRLRWDPPAGVTPRGTAVVFAGRGEGPDVYRRFGLRLSGDGYVVIALASGQVAIPADVPNPTVLVGSDVGALHALVHSDAPEIAAVIAAGTPLSTSVETFVDANGAPRDEELDIRTACPTHRSLLSSDEVGLRWGALLGEPVAEALVTAAAAVRPDVPVLFIHGDSDRAAHADPVRGLASQMPIVSLVTVRDGRHDVLNDISHRSVAAQIVQFLERVRSADYIEPILLVEIP